MSKKKFMVNDFPKEYTSVKFSLEFLYLSSFSDRRELLSYPEKEYLLLLLH